MLSEEVERRTPDPHGHSAALGPLFHNRSRKEFNEGYTTEIFTDYAIDFLDRHRDEPFFLTVTYNAVHHLIHEVPDRYLEKFDAEKVPNYDPNEGGNRKWYLANLTCLDDNIGRLLDAFDEFDLSRNTLVIFFGDNGGCRFTGASNKPLSGAKSGLLEGGIRVPFMMRFPGRFPKGLIYPHVISTLDIVPTCLQAAGIDVPTDRQLDGIGLLEEFSKSSPGKIEREPLFWHYQDQFAVREGDWKLVQTKPLWRPEGVHLYNLKSDLVEEEDLAEQRADVFKRLMDRYEQWRKMMQVE